MDGACAEKPGAAAEFAAFQIKLVAQHPQKRHVAVDIDRPLRTVNFDCIRHDCSRLACRRPSYRLPAMGCIAAPLKRR